MRRIVATSFSAVAVVVLVVGLAAADGVRARKAKAPCERSVAEILGSNPCPLPSVTDASSLLTAGVMENGDVLAGTPGTTASRDAEGLYSVRFTRSVASCAWNVTPAQVGNNQPPQRAFVRALAGADANTVLVVVVDPSGVDMDSPFHVTAAC